MSFWPWSDIKRKKHQKEAFPTRVLPSAYKEGVLYKEEDAVLMEFPNSTSVVESAWTLYKGSYYTEDDSGDIGKKNGFDTKFTNLFSRFGDFVVYGYIVNKTIYVSDIYSRTRGHFFDYDDMFHIAVRELRVNVLPALYRGKTLDSIEFIKKFFVPSYFDRDKMPSAILIRPVSERTDSNIGRINLLLPI